MVVEWQESLWYAPPSTGGHCPPSGVVGPPPRGRWPPPTRGGYHASKLHMSSNHIPVVQLIPNPTPWDVVLLGGSAHLCAAHSLGGGGKMRRPPPPPGVALQTRECFPFLRISGFRTLVLNHRFFSRTKHPNFSRANFLWVIYFLISIRSSQVQHAGVTTQFKGRGNDPQRALRGALIWILPEG